MDISMPLKNGRQAMAEILEMDPGATVIITTGDIHEKWVQENALSGAKGLFKKPFEMTNLLKALAHHVMGEVEKA